MSNYTIEAILTMLKQKEEERFFGEITLSYQQGKIAYTKIMEIKKAEDEGTTRTKRGVPDGLQI